MLKRSFIPSATMNGALINCAISADHQPRRLPAERAAPLTHNEHICRLAIMNIEYEIALSFADEDRGLVEQVAVGLRRRRVKVFYDQFEQAKLWGKDLYQYLFDLYPSKSKYCVVFVS